MTDSTPNYHLIRILKDMRHFASKRKDITVPEYDAWIKAQVDEAIGEPHLAVVREERTS